MFTFIGASRWRKMVQEISYAGVKTVNNTHRSFPAWLHGPDTSQYCQLLLHWLWHGASQVSGFEYEWVLVYLCSCTYEYTSLCLCVCQRKSVNVWCVTCLSVCNIHLTSLSLCSYLLAFLPWLFLLSFFRSDWDLSRESCFILCSIWYLLNVAWNSGKIHVNARALTWYMQGPCQGSRNQDWATCSIQT